MELSEGVRSEVEALSMIFNNEISIVSTQPYEIYVRISQQYSEQNILFHNDTMKCSDYNSSLGKAFYLVIRLSKEYPKVRPEISRLQSYQLSTHQDKAMLEAGKRVLEETRETYLLEIVNAMREQLNCIDLVSGSSSQIRLISSCSGGKPSSSKLVSLSSSDDESFSDLEVEEFDEAPETEGAFSDISDTAQALTHTTPIRDINSALPDLTSARYKSDFEELRVLGKGSYGIVYLAKNLYDNNLYAIKIIKNCLTPQEVRFLASFNHENIVRYYSTWIEEYSYDDSSDDDDSRYGCTNTATNTQFSVSATVSFSKSVPRKDEIVYFENDSEDEDSEDEDSDDSIDSDDGTDRRALFIQMEYCDDNLEQFLSKGPLSTELRTKFFKEIVQGLHYVHQQNVIHRDLKPQNIFLSGPNNQIKIGDFGISLSSNEKNDSNNGTELYRAPELDRDHQSPNPSHDIYSLGIILFEMCYFFKTKSERVKSLRILREEGVRGLIRNKSIPSDFEKSFEKEVGFINAMISKNPEERPSTEVLLEKLSVGEKLNVLEGLRQGTAFFSNVLEILFKEKNDQYFVDHYDEDASSVFSIPFLKNIGNVRQRFTELFVNHDAVLYDAPLFQPVRNDFPINSNAYLGPSGNLFAFNTNLLLPFVRTVGFRRNIDILRRFSFGVVYRIRKNCLYPIEHPLCSFDIIYNRAVVSKEERCILSAEVLVTIKQILNLYSNYKDHLTLHLNHFDFTYEILSACGIPHEQYFKAFSEINQKTMKGTAKHGHSGLSHFALSLLGELGKLVSAQSIAKLKDFLKKATTCVKPKDVIALYMRTFSSRPNVLKQIKVILKCFHLFGDLDIHLDPLLCVNRQYYDHGLVFQLRNTNEKSYITGGQYNHLFCTLHPKRKVLDGVGFIIDMNFFAECEQKAPQKNIIKGNILSHPEGNPTIFIASGKPFLKFKIASLLWGRQLHATYFPDLCHFNPPDCRFTIRVPDYRSGEKNESWIKVYDQANDEESTSTIAGFIDVIINRLTAKSTISSVSIAKGIFYIAKEINEYDESKIANYLNSLKDVFSSIIVVVVPFSISVVQEFITEDLHNMSTLKSRHQRFADQFDQLEILLQKIFKKDSSVPFIVLVSYPDLCFEVFSRFNLVNSATTLKASSETPKINSKKKKRKGKIFSQGYE